MRKETALAQAEEQMHNERRIREMALNPFPAYRRMRESNPVFYSEESRCWQVFRYDDVLHVLTDYTTFSVVASDQATIERQRKEWGEDDPIAQSMVSLDPPRHSQLRALASRAFTPRAVAQLRPRITQIVNDLLDQVVTTGQMDIIQDLSYPFPVIVIAELLGIPIEDRGQFKRWSDAIIESSTGVATEQVRMQAVQEMNNYFRHIIAKLRAHPTEDLISGLLAAEVNGEKLSERELLSFCALLLIAGNITTKNLIGNVILCLDEHPGVMDQLRKDPSLLPGAIEEVLRYRSPVQGIGRVATVDAVIGGKQMKAGQSLALCLGSANRDEAQFPDPDVFDIRRTPNRHVAFGHGIHFCLGAPLARLETRIALDVLLQRLSTIERVREVPLELVPGFYGVKRLPITFQAETMVR